MRSLDIGCAGIVLSTEGPEGVSRSARLKGTVSVSVLSVVVAGGVGSTGQAQEATPLPPLEVTAAAGWRGARRVQFGHGPGLLGEAGA
jgi:hypothetical protein